MKQSDADGLERDQASASATESGAADQRQLALRGRRRIEWVRAHMPILHHLEREFEKSAPFSGLKVALSIHLEAKTAYLAMVIRAGGADVRVTGSNPLSTKDETVAALRSLDVEVYAKHGVTLDEMHEHQKQTLAFSPDIIIDDGGDLVHIMHEEFPDRVNSVRGACEETTAGVMRNHARHARGALHMPVHAINDSPLKYLFDNRHGTGQSTWDAVMRTTNQSIAGAVVVVVGYGWCGRGIAERARGLGARVSVAEVDAIKAVEAHLEGYRVAPLASLLPEADFVITATGVVHSISRDHFSLMKNGCVIANAGHFADEIDTGVLGEVASERREFGEYLEGFHVSESAWIYLIADGKIVNIAAGDGHPAEILDTSFALQALTAEMVARQQSRPAPGVIEVPDQINYRVAELKLAGLGVLLDTLSPEQAAYLQSYERM